MGFWVNFDWHFHSNRPTLATLHPCPQPLPQHGSLSDTAMASSQRKVKKKKCTLGSLLFHYSQAKSKAFGLAFKILCDLVPAVSLTSPSAGATGPAIRTLCTVSLVILWLRTLNSLLYSTEHLPGSGCSRCSVTVLSGTDSSLLSAAWSWWPV